MSNFEFNKAFAAVLCAGITVMVGGILSHKVIHAEELEKDAVTIEGSVDEHGGGETSSGPQTADPILALLATADVEKGAKISKACAACHSFEKGGPIKQGPDLWGVIGRAKGSTAGFDYSEGMKTKGGNWDYASLNEFLWKPKKYIQGTKMNFIGLKKPEERAAMIAWLRQQSDSPAALPTEAEIAAEAAAAAPPPAPEGAEPVEGTAAPADGEKAAEEAAKSADEKAAEEKPAEAAPAEAPKH